MKKLSIVIPVFNNYNYTLSLLKDLEKLPNDHEIIIVDNGSTDNTRHLKTENSNLVISRNKSNKGFSTACNQGWSLSSGKYVCFLNNDVRIKNNHDSWTKNIIKECDSRCLVGPTIGLLDRQFNFVKEDKVFPKNFIGHLYMSGWNLSANSDVWLELNTGNGPWCEDFFAFFEDGDLSFRAKQLGIEFKLIDTEAHHFGHKTANKMNISKLYKQSREIFTKKWLNKI